MTEQHPIMKAALDLVMYGVATLCGVAALTTPTTMSDLTTGATFTVPTVFMVAAVFATILGAFGFLATTLNILNKLGWMEEDA